MIRVNQSSKSRSTRRTNSKKARYKIRNWSEYNDSLVKRGSITLWISEEDIGSWKPEAQQKRGGQLQYTDGAIQCMLMVRSAFHLTLRATEGFVRSVFELIELELSVPDYTTICKGSKCLRVSLPRNAKGPLHAVLDSPPQAESSLVRASGRCVRRGGWVFQASHLAQAALEL